MGDWVSRYPDEPGLPCPLDPLQSWQSLVHDHRVVWRELEVVDLQDGEKPRLTSIKYINWEIFEEILR